MAKADVSTINQWFKTAQDEWADYRDRARKAYKFYFGEQWEANAQQKMKIEGKPCLTFNKIKPIVRTLSGYQRQNRKDLIVSARRGGIQSVASVYTELIKYVMDTSYCDWYSAYMYVDGIIGGKGWLSLDVTYNNDPISGDLQIMREDPFLIMEDPFSMKYDLSDAKYLFRSRWVDKKQIEMMFPKVKDTSVNLELEGLGNVHSQVESDDYTDAERRTSFEIAKNRYLVKECWYREQKRTKYLVKPDLEIVDVTNEKQELLDVLLATRPELKQVDRVMPRLNMAIIMGNEIIHEEEDPYNGCNKFPIVRFANELIYAEKCMIRGEVDDIIDPQEEHNKRKSQTLHHLNSSANSGFIVEKTAMSPEELRKLESIGSRPGVVVTVEDGKLGSIQRMSPTPISDGHLSLAQIADNDMKGISGVNADLLGSDKSEANSGVAMEMRRRQGLINLEPVFDNYDFSTRVFGDTLLDVIRKTDIYTTDEIINIVGKKPLTIDGKPVDMNGVRDYLRSRAGNYSVVMNSQQNNPTMRIANFQDMIRAVKEAQIPVPPDMIVEASDWEFKDRWLEWNKQQQGQVPQGQPSPEQGIPPAIEQFMAQGGQV